MCRPFGQYDGRTLSSGAFVDDATVRIVYAKAQTLFLNRLFSGCAAYRRVDRSHTIIAVLQSQGEWQHRCAPHDEHDVSALKVERPLVWCRRAMGDRFSHSIA